MTAGPASLASAGGRFIRRCLRPASAVSGRGVASMAPQAESQVRTDPVSTFENPMVARYSFVELSR